MNMFADLQSEPHFQGRDDILLTDVPRLVTLGWLTPGIWEDDGVITLSGLVDTLEGRLLGLPQECAVLSPKDPSA